MTTILPVHVFSQLVKCQSSFRWTIGCARRWKSLISPTQRATLQEIQKLLVSSKINSSSLPDLHSLFPDQVVTKAEEEICRNEERHSSGQSHRRQGHFHPYAPSDKSVHQPDQKSGNPAWKQIRDRQQAKKSHGKPSTFSQKPAKGSKPRK